jgi:CheY-like chemotaxis protein
MEAVGQLTGGIAHDFNNLLQVIIGNTEILAEGLPDNSREEKLAHMTLMAARRGAELTSQLLSFSRRQALQPRPTDIEQLIGESEGLMQRAGGASIAIKRVFAPDLWHAVVDPGMLQTALLNLVFNARDAMPDGGRITIAAENVVCDHAYVSRHGVVRPGEYVRIAVCDSGMGIPAGLLERVFEPFFTTKDVGKGSGLGLSMVYGFAQQSDGAVRIESTEGKGTTVYLYLPRSLVKAPNETEPAPRVATPRGSETILVVEDDALVREFAVGALRGLGYTVLAATDGDAALHALRIHKDPVHLLFSDIIMPGGMTGWQLAEIATAMRPSLKVLLTSGYAEGSAGPGRDHTAFGAVLAKPYGKSELARSVRSALASHRKIRVH